MFMHMSKRFGIAAFVVVGICLGTYYVLVLREPSLGPWKVMQGHGRLVTDDGSSYVEIDYAVRRPTEPLFAYRRLRVPREVDPKTALCLRFRSAFPALVVMTVREADGSLYRTRALLVPSTQWERTVHRSADFTLVPSPGNVDENGRCDFEQLTSRMEFFDGSGTTFPPVAYVNRLELSAPEFDDIEWTSAPSTDDEAATPQTPPIQGAP